MANGWPKLPPTEGVTMKALWQVREDAFTTIEQLAERTGLDPQYLRDVEALRVRAEDAEVARIAAALGCAVDTIRY